MLAESFVKPLVASHVPVRALVMAEKAGVVGARVPPIALQLLR
jgi:hypothetical protein